MQPKERFERRFGFLAAEIVEDAPGNRGCASPVDHPP
jgi:hypothetical protein